MVVRSMLPKVALVAALGSTLVACGQKKINECNALIGVINNNVQGLEKNPKVEGDANGAADLRAMADAMDKVSADAAKVELTIPDLKKIATEYSALAKDVAKAAREMAASAEAHDVAKITAAQQAMEKAVKQEDPLVENLNKFCQAP